MDQKVAWYCRNCGRQELPEKQKMCPECGIKMQRCSRYEWFLIDELIHLLDLKERDYHLIPQYPIGDHRGFVWYWDIYVWVNGPHGQGGYGELIEVNGLSHQSQPIYGGRGGGYTHDYDKQWEALNSIHIRHKNIDFRTVSNDECTKKDDVVYHTAIAIVDYLVHRADISLNATWSITD